MLQGISCSTLYRFGICKEHINSYNSWLLPRITIQVLQHHVDINMNRSVLNYALSYARDRTMAGALQSDYARISSSVQ